MAEIALNIAGHTLAFYAKLEELSTKNEKDDGLFFIGNVTDVFARAGISKAHYSVIRRILVETKAIEILQRGNGAVPSVVKLNGAPDPETFYIASLTAPRRLATLMADLEKRLEALEAWRESQSVNVLQALRDHEVRITKMERRENAKATQEGNGS